MFIESRQEMYSCGEPINIEVFPIEMYRNTRGGNMLQAKLLKITYVQGRLKKNGGGKALKAIFFSFGNVQG